MRDKRLAALLATKKADNIAGKADKIRGDIRAAVRCCGVPKLGMKVNGALNRGVLGFVEELEMLDGVRCDIVGRRRCV